MSDSIKPPYDLEAERGVLSSILLDKEALIKAAEMLNADDFYDPAHQIIYSACLELFENATAVDIVTVKAHLTRQNLLKKVGGLKYISELVAILPLTTNVEYYAKIIREASTRRKIISISSDLVALGVDENKKIEEIVDEVEKRIFSISQQSKSKGFSHIKDVLMEATQRLEEQQNDPEALKGIGSGFSGLNDILGGFHKGDLVIIAARPSVGKTSFMLELARYMSINLKKKIAIFSLEMGKEQLADRMLSLQSGLNLMDVRMGTLDGNKYQQYTEAMGELYDADILIDDIPGQHIMEIRSKCRKLDLEIGVDAVFIDYLQLLHGTSRGKDSSRALEVTEISQGLKNLARELRVPVVALSQLNRSVESRNNRRPQLSDLRESGSIEQDADVVMFLHREAMYNRDLEESEKDKAEVIIAKHRNGAVGIAQMRFIAEQAKYVDVEQGAQN